MKRRMVVTVTRRKVYLDVRLLTDYNTDRAQ
jgi:hypothetical protein